MKYSINQTKKALGEAQTVLHWYVLISNPPKALKVDKDIVVRVTTATLPTANVENTQLQLQGHTINYTGKITKAGEITWNFYEGTDAKVTNLFMEWAKLRWGGDGKDTTGKQILTNDVKADITMKLLGPNDEVTQTYVLIGAMPKLEPGGQLGQTSEPLQPVITWDFDDFHWGPGDSTTW